MGGGGQDVNFSVLGRWQTGSRTYNGRDERFGKFKIDTSGIVCGRIHRAPVEGSCWRKGVVRTAYGGLAVPRSSLEAVVRGRSVLFEVDNSWAPGCWERGDEADRMPKMVHFAKGTEGVCGELSFRVVDLVVTKREGTRTVAAPVCSQPEPKYLIQHL